MITMSDNRISGLLCLKSREASKVIVRMNGYLDASNWRFSASSPAFPGIDPVSVEVFQPSSSAPQQLEKTIKTCFTGQRLNAVSHPHLRLDLEGTMVSIPKVQPGDMVFWHCDGLHSVEDVHYGEGDSSGAL